MQERIVGSCIAYISSFLNSCEADAVRDDIDDPVSDSKLITKFGSCITTLKRQLRSIDTEINDLASDCFDPINAGKEALAHATSNLYFFDYAASFWSYHAEGPPEKTLQTELINFLNQQWTRAGAIPAAYSDTISKISARPSPLQVAVEQGLVHIAAVLIDQGLDVNEEIDGLLPDIGTQLIAVAVWNEDMSMCRLLLSRGAHPKGDQDQIDHFWMLTQQDENEEVFQLFLEFGASTSGLVSTRLFALADHEVSADRVLNMIERGANVDGGKPLIVATQLGLIEIAQRLLEKGADIHDIDRGCGGYNAVNALSVAIKMGHVDMAKLLLDWGANLFPQSDEDSWFAIESAKCYACSGVSEEMVSFLVRIGCNPSSISCDPGRPRDDYTWREATMLHSCAMGFPWWSSPWTGRLAARKILLRTMLADLATEDWRRLAEISEGFGNNLLKSKIQHILTMEKSCVNPCIDKEDVVLAFLEDGAQQWLKEMAKRRPDLLDIPITSYDYEEEELSIVWIICFENFRFSNTWTAM